MASITTPHCAQAELRRWRAKEEGRDSATRRRAAQCSQPRQGPAAGVEPDCDKDVNCAAEPLATGPADRPSGASCARCGPTGDVCLPAAVSSKPSWKTVGHFVTLCRCGRAGGLLSLCCCPSHWQTTAAAAAAAASSRRRCRDFHPALFPHI